MDLKTTKGDASEKSADTKKGRSSESNSNGKQADKKRRKPSDIQFAHIIEKINEGFVALDAQMNYTYINQRGSELLNRKPEDLIGKNYWDEYPEDKNTPFGQAYLRALETQIPIELEDYYAPGDRWFKNRIFPFGDGISIFFNDITERKRAESAMRESEERFQTLANGSPVLLWVNGLEGCEFVNREYLSFLGIATETDVRGYDWSGFVHPDDRDAYMAAYLRAFEKQAVFSAEFRFRRHDGQYRWMRSEATPRRAEDGSFLGYVGASVDITMRKRTEHALAESARQQEALYELSDRLQHTKSLEDVFNAALGAILSALQCDRASILLFDNAEVMRFVAWRGLSDDYRKATDGHSPWKPDEKDPEPISMDDIHTAELSDSLRAVIKREGIGSLAFIPLVFNGKLIGKFMTYFNTPHIFSESETELSQTIARQLAISIERKRDEEVLRASEERVRLATQAARMFTWELDIKTQTSTVADDFAEALGFSPDLILKDNEDILERFIHPEDTQLILEALSKSIQNRSDTLSVQYRILNPENGQPIWLDVNGKVIYDSNGNPERMFGVAQNITETKQTEGYIRYLNTELQARLNEMNTLLEILPTGVWIGNHDSSEITGNPAAYRILGFERGINVSVTNPERQVPMGLRLFINGKEVAPENAPMQVVARSGEPWHGFEHELLFPDGTRKAVYGSVVPLFDEHGAVRKVIASYTDFTERKQAENRLALLAEISELMRKFEDPNELMYATAKTVGEHFHVRRCLFNETDVENDVEIVQRDYTNGVQSVAGVHKLSDYSSITSAEMSAGKTVVNYDAKTDVRTADDYEGAYARNGERAYIAVPLMRENQWVGTLWVSDDKPRRWTKEEVSLLETIAERVWIVIEKLRINATLRESEARYRFIVENTSDGIWHIELTEPMPISLPENEQLDWYYEHAVIRQCNLGLARMYGYNSVEEVLGMPMREVMPRENPVNLELSLQFIRSGYRLVDAESRETNPDGRELVFLNNMVGVIEDGKLKGEWGTNRDITERKRIEDERNQLLQQEQAQRVSAEQAKIEAEQAKAEAERELAERKLAEAALGEWADTPLPQDKRSPWLRYGAALVVTLIAVLVRAAFDPLLGDALALVTIYGAVAFSVWFGGIGPAILSVLVGYVAVTGLIIEPRQVVTLNAQTVTGFALFLFSNTVVMALGETMRRAQRHAHQSARVAIERQRQVETQLLEKQRVEEALRRNEQMFSTLVDAAPFGVYFIDSEFHLRAINQGSEAVFRGIHPLIGRDFAEILRIIWQEPFASEVIERFRHTLRTGESFISPPVIEPRANIEEIEAYDWQIHRITLSDGTYGVVCYFYDLSEQKQLEATVRASEELYRTIARSIPGGGIYVVDKEFRYLVAEGPVTYAFGLSREMLEGHTVSEVFPPEPSARMVERLKRNFSGETLSYETNHNGRVYWTQQAPLQDSLGNAIVVTLDITARKQAEEALRRSEERFARFMQYLPGLAWIKDLEGRYVYANAAAEKAFNTPLEKIYGSTDEEIFPAEFAAQFRRNDELALMDEKGVQVTETLQHKDGVLHYSLVSKFPIPGPEGKTALLGGTAFDITERKQAEEALRESEERFHAILRQATAGIVRKDAEGRFMFVNQAFCNMLGYTESELLGKTVWQFTHQDDVEENKRLYNRTMMEGIPFKLEKRLIRADGSTVWVDVSVSPIMDAAGKPQSAVAVEVDISRRKLAEESLHELNVQLENRVQKRTAELQVVNQSLRDEITERQKVEDALHESRKRLQILSQRLVDVQEEERRAIARELHDRVGQSLSALNINLVILDNQISSHVPEQISARLDDSMQLVAETITLVRDVMSDLRPPVLDDYGLEAALQSHVDAFRSRYGIDVRFEKPDQPIPRLGASIEMTFLRIAQEALMNVARHARAEKVTLSIRQDGNVVRLVVQDNGTGITSWQDANRPGSHGLIIMRERAEALGGDLNVSSVPGEGTKVDASIRIEDDSHSHNEKEK